MEPFRLLVDGSEVFSTLFEIIGSAKQSIWLETFIFSDDSTGWQVAELLVQQAKAGLDVRVIVDKIGMVYFTLGNPRQLYGRYILMAYLRRHGVRVLWNGSFNPLQYKLDHRKLIVIDESSAMIGGMNIGDDYQYRWHDAMLFIHKKTIVDTLVHCFQMEWKKKRLRSKWLKEENREYNILIADFPKKDIEKDLLKRIKKAKNEIWIAVAYCTDLFLVRSLIQASKRGILVHVIVPKKSNHLLTRIQHAFILHYLRKNGVHVWVYGKAMMHLKLYLIDDYVSFGTANGTFWSMNYNKELHLGTNDMDVVNAFRDRILYEDRPFLKKVTSFLQIVG